FIANWQKLNPGQTSHWALQSEAALKAGLSPQAELTPTAVLTTSHQGWQIEAALIQTINEAREIIRIEHAYLYHEPIEVALRAAKARGVEIQLLFSERSDESLFDRLNPGNALKLMQAPGPGKVRCWLWPVGKGEHDYMIHTKYLSVDGRKAIAGSANLIPRSLQSPFRVGDQPLLFNEELVLYLDDPRFVSRLDQELFIADRDRSKEYDQQALQALLDARGGALELLIERLKGLLA
ncbi:MAG: hypothetical protein CVV27_06020, partial [Candidatus Melainabacteria bacterium HGW-Melainabacteria-1]